MGVARLSTRLALWRGGGSLLGEALRRAGPALGEEPALLGWLGSPSAAQLASLSQARWLSTGAAPPTLDEGQAAELAKALRSQQLLDALEPLRAITSAVPHHKLLEIAQQQ